MEDKRSRKSGRVSETRESEKEKGKAEPESGKEREIERMKRERGMQKSM